MSDGYLRSQLDRGSSIASDGYLRTQESKSIITKIVIFVGNLFSGGFSKLSGGFNG